MDFLLFWCLTVCQKTFFINVMRTLGPLIAVGIVIFSTWLSFAQQSFLNKRDNVAHATRARVSEQLKKNCKLFMRSKKSHAHLFTPFFIAELYLKFFSHSAICVK